MANMNFGVNILPKANNTYSLGNSDYKWNIFANTLNGISFTNIVSDIQINGTSIVNNGIANIPYSDGVTAGVIKIGPGLTIGSDGIARINKALDALIKAGSNEFQPITPSKQHISVFYGLARAAGDSTQSASNNTTGTYTDGAKNAIQSMLGIPALLNDKADKTDTILNTTLSRGRKENTTVGTGSIAFGEDVIASGNKSQAFGYSAIASGDYSSASGVHTNAGGYASHAEGFGVYYNDGNTTETDVHFGAIGDYSHTEGNDTSAFQENTHAEGLHSHAVGKGSHAEGYTSWSSGSYSHAGGILGFSYGDGSFSHGIYTQTNGMGSYALGQCNVEDIPFQEWEANHQYAIGDIIWYRGESNVYSDRMTEQYANHYYKCLVANSDAKFNIEHWDAIVYSKFIETIGNGAFDWDNEVELYFSNARALDWQGNEYLNGDLYVNCTNDSTGGSKVATESYVSTVIGNKAETIISSTSGTAASFSDGANNVPMKSCAIKLLPHQTGEDDPSPSNIRPIVAWDEAIIIRYGGNLLENKTATRATTSIYIGQDTASAFPIHFIKGVTYSISFEQDATGAPQVYFNTQDATSTAHLFCEGTQGTYTAERTENVRLYVYNSKGITSISNFCLTIGDTPVNEPYTQATEYSVTFPNELDDIYGGIVDVIKGEVKVTHKKIVVSKSEFTGGGTAGLGYKQTEAKYPTCKSLVNWDLARETQKCNKGLISNPYSESDYGDYVGIIYALDSQSQSQARISDALYQTLGENDTVEFVYELNEPITYTFTPIEIRTLLGYNSFCADSNNIEVEYVADTKVYVDTKLANMANTIVTHIPVATTETLGIVKSGGMGVNINSSGQLYISTATSSHIKAGTQAWTPITPNRQHEAVFYGLAKAAGDSTQSASSNAVGIYTDAAKTAIQNMLEVPSKHDLEILNSTANAFDLLVGDYQVTDSLNLYDPSLQTVDTIDPHYYTNGEPYSTTQYDNSWNCTNYISVKPNTEYTIGLIGNTDEIVKPWHNAGYGWFAYNSNKQFISGGTSNTFTTPSNTAYIRFNYYKASDKVSLTKLNEQCVLVEGNSLPNVYIPYGRSITSDLQKKIDNGFEWKISGSDLLISYGLNNINDIVIVMNRGRANNLFDFAKLCTKPKHKSLFDLETNDLTVVWSAGTDIHSPFQLNAINNADGYHSDATDAGFVGGSHTLDQLGTGYETAESKYIYYYADGKPVSSGYGIANNFEIRWANDVQAYNTVKQGGGGRACLTEYHSMIFDGVQFNETVKLVALEDIYISLWYGFQLVSWGNTYTNLRFMNATNRIKYTSENVNSGNLLCSGIEAWGSDHKAIITVDNNFDLGKREEVNEYYSDGAFTSGGAGKVYFRIISRGANNFIVNEGEAYYLKGSFKFCSAIAE